MITSEIKTSADVGELVHHFYAVVRKDELLGPIFEDRIPEENWEKHLVIMTMFWSNVLLQQPGYRGNPMAKHVGLPMSHAALDRWLELWKETVRNKFTGPVAEDAMETATSIADRFRVRLVDVDLFGLH